MPVRHKETVCLFCSICCEVATEIHDNGIVLPDYVDRRVKKHKHGTDLSGGWDGRICGRGHLISELLSHPRRLNAAQIKGEMGKKIVSSTDAISVACKRLKAISSPSNIAIIIDGNLPCEDIQAASEFTKKCLKTEHVAVYLPPSDKALLDGIGAAGADFLTRESLGSCDTVIVLGDAFAAHPLVAKTILDAKNARRGNQLAVIDSFVNTTAKFTPNFIRHVPGTEHILLMGITKALDIDSDNLKSQLDKISYEDISKITGVDLFIINNIAFAVKNARRLGIVISSEIGRNNSLELIGALAYLIGRCPQTEDETDSGIIPLLSYGNAMGAYTLSRRVGFSSLSKVLNLAKEGKIKAMIVIGTDLFSSLPQRVAEESLSNLDLLISCAPLPNATTERSDIVLPSALWFEEEGTVLDMSAVPRTVQPLLNPPSGAMTIKEILSALNDKLSGGKMDVELNQELLIFKNSGDLSEVFNRCSSTIDAESSKSEEYLLIPIARSINFADGSLTKLLQWPSLMESAPILRMNIHDAEELNISNGEEVRIRSKNGELVASVSLKDGPPSGIVAVSSQFSESRSLFDWKIDSRHDRISVGPTRVTLSKII